MLLLCVLSLSLEAEEESTNNSEVLKCEGDLPFSNSTLCEIY